MSAEEHTTRTSTDIAELDAVVFTLAVGRWPAGTEGVVLEVFPSGALVEVADDDGQTRAWRSSAARTQSQVAAARSPERR